MSKCSRALNALGALRARHETSIELLGTKEGSAAWRSESARARRFLSNSLSAARPNENFPTLLTGLACEWAHWFSAETAAEELWALEAASKRLWIAARARAGLAHVEPMGSSTLCALVDFHGQPSAGGRDTLWLFKRLSDEPLVGVWARGAREELWRVRQWAFRREPGALFWPQPSTDPALGELLSLLGAPKGPVPRLSAKRSQLRLDQLDQASLCDIPEPGVDAPAGFRFGPACAVRALASRFEMAVGASAIGASIEAATLTQSLGAGVGAIPSRSRSL